MQYLEPNDCLHAVGQGALAVECREGDADVLAAVGELHHRDTLLACVAERAFMRRLEGGCSAPVAAHASAIEGGLRLEGGVWSLDGAETRRAVMTVLFDDAAQGLKTVCMLYLVLFLAE